MESPVVGLTLFILVRITSKIPLRHPYKTLGYATPFFVVATLRSTLRRTNKPLNSIIISKSSSNCNNLKLESGHLDPTALRGLVDSAIRGRGEKNTHGEGRAASSHIPCSAGLAIERRWPCQLHAEVRPLVRPTPNLSSAPSLGPRVLAVSVVRAERAPRSVVARQGRSSRATGRQSAVAFAVSQDRSHRGLEATNGASSALPQPR